MLASELITGQFFVYRLKNDFIQCYRVIADTPQQDVVPCINIDNTEAIWYIKETQEVFI